MNKRILVPLALLVPAVLCLAACGGGGSGAEGEITETIEKVITGSDPGDCTELETQKFVEQDNEEEGKAAIKSCEEEAKAGKEQTEAVEVSNISVNGKKATAEVIFEGGSLTDQALELGLIEENGTWKVDQIEGFAKYDGAALGKAFEKSFEEEPGELNKQEAACISEGIAIASQAEAEELFFSGSTEKIEELAEGCA